MHVTMLDEGLSSEDRTILLALRLICMSYTEPASLAWESALETCDIRFGPERGPQIGMAVLKCFKALRLARTGGFNFTNPACPCCRENLSSHERAFMRLLAAIRTENSTSRQAQALVLCEGADPGPLLHQAANLVRLLKLHSDWPA
ncbi:hypothetical protein [Roseibium sp. M-1]